MLRYSATEYGFSSGGKFSSMEKRGATVNIRPASDMMECLRGEPVARIIFLDFS